MNTIKTIVLFLLLLLVIIVFGSIYTVKEGQNSILLRLGKLEKNPKTGRVEIKNPGLHFKIPFIEKARIFDTRIQTLDVEHSRIVTAEKKDVIVDYYVKWRIDDLALYYTRTGGNPLIAGRLLRQQLNDSLRAEFGRRNIAEVVSDDRSMIMEALLKQANISAKSLGIEVIDVRIKGIDLPPEVSAAVFERMRAERERVASEHRSEGKASAEAIQASADATVTVTIAKAKAAGAKIRATGTKEAAKLYNDTYKKDPDFYAFYRSLEAYQASFASKNDLLVLRPDSQFFKYFNNVGKRVLKNNKR